MRRNPPTDARARATRPAQSARRGEAGFTIVEAVLAAVILLGGLLLLSGLLGAEAARKLLNDRQQLGLEWAKTGMSDIKARARRAPDDEPRTEYGVITTCDGCQTLLDGSARKTTPDGYNMAGEMSQQFAHGDVSVDFLPPVSYGGMTLEGPTGSRAIVIGWGGDMSIRENGATLADTLAGTLTRHAAGDRYRITSSGNTWSYWRIRGTTRELLLSDSAMQQPGFPLRSTFWLYYQNSEISNMKLSGVFVDTLALPDGGDLTPGSPCVSPYCDFVWRAPRTGAEQPAPQALAPGAAAPDGAELLFVRRFKVTTIDSPRGLREINMSLAAGAAAEPFTSLTTRVTSSK